MSAHESNQSNNKTQDELTRKFRTLIDDPETSKIIFDELNLYKKEDIEASYIEAKTLLLKKIKNDKLEADTIHLKYLITLTRKELANKVEKKFRNIFGDPDTMKRMLQSLKSYQKEDVNDTYTEVGFKLLEKIKEGGINDKNLKGLFFRSVTNKLKDILKKRQKNKHTSFEDGQGKHAIQDDLDPLNYLIMDEDKQTVRKAFEQMWIEHEKCARLLELSIIEGHSSKEIGEEMGYNSEHVVNTTKLRCLRKFKTIFYKL